MGNERASIFEGSEDINLSGFTPKKNKDKKSPTKEQVMQVSQAAKFSSREPNIAVNTPTKREKRHYRTGRNIQLNVKVSQETINGFYEISDQQEWVLGETLEYAVAALRKELTSKVRKNS
jgi:hypothetical protein